MPYYKFIDKTTGEELEIRMKHSELEQYYKDNPDHQRVFEFPKISTTNSNTFLDGFAPNSRKQLLTREKEALALESEMYGKKAEDRGKYKEEIKKIRSDAKPEIGTNKGSKQ